MVNWLELCGAIKFSNSAYKKAPTIPDFNLVAGPFTVRSLWITVSVNLDHSLEVPLWPLVCLRLSVDSLRATGQECALFFFPQHSWTCELWILSRGGKNKTSQSISGRTSSLTWTTRLFVILTPLRRTISIHGVKAQVEVVQMGLPGAVKAK